MEHRLPENHNCRGEPLRTPLGSWQSKNIPRDKESKSSIMESEGDFHFVKKTPANFQTKREKCFPVKKIIAVFSVLTIIIIIAWQYPAIISILQSSSFNSDASYTRLLLRDLPIGHVASSNGTVEFGDTEYYFAYSGGMIGISAPFQYDSIMSPKMGNSYKALGIEVKVANVSSDYISSFAVIMVKPTVTNYMFSTYRYTKVDVPLGNEKTVEISSGLTNEKDQFTFAYASAPNRLSFGATLIVRTSFQSKQYSTYAGLVIPEAEKDFNIEIHVYKADSNNMIIYVKPLY
jgi:hypothetical protein